MIPLIVISIYGIGLLMFFWAAAAITNGAGNKPQYWQSFVYALQWPWIVFKLFAKVWWK